MSMIWHNSGPDIQKSEVYSSPEAREFSVAGSLYEKSFSCEESETDQDSVASSEEMESPRSVAKVSRRTAKKLRLVHSQILRIREEDLHLGDGESAVNAIDKLKLSVPSLHHYHQIAASDLHKNVNVMLFSRPILPASPLSGKMAIKPVH